MSKMIDLTGNTFGKLIVVSRAENDKRCQARWNCKCDCQRETVVIGNSLRRGNIKSCGKCGLVYGHGINDILGNQCCNGDRYYRAWTQMLTRCYSKNAPDKYPAYLQCTVDPDWLFFSVFKEWMQQQDWQGKELDKDILYPGNKHYSADTCVFVTPRVNKLIADNPSYRGKLPQGVSFDRPTGKYMAYVKISGASNNLGRFTTAEEAQQAYIKAKVQHLFDVSGRQNNALVEMGLIRHAVKYMTAMDDQ